MNQGKSRRGMYVLVSCLIFAIIIKWICLWVQGAGGQDMEREVSAKNPCEEIKRKAESGQIAEKQPVRLNRRVYYGEKSFNGKIIRGGFCPQAYHTAWNTCNVWSVFQYPVQHRRSGLCRADSGSR